MENKKVTVASAIELANTKRIEKEGMNGLEKESRNWPQSTFVVTKTSGQRDSLFLMSIHS